MVQNDFDSIESDGPGLLEDKSLQIHIPVTLTIPGSYLNLKDDFVAKGSVPVFSYSSNMTNVITSNELRGPNMYYARIQPRETLGIDDLALSAPARDLVDLKGLSKPTDRRRRKLDRRSLIRITNSRPEQAKCLRPYPDPKLQLDPCDSGRRDEPRHLPLEHLLDLVAWKQFPHHSIKNKACYQALEYINRKAHYDQTAEKDHGGGKAEAETADYLETHWDLESSETKDEDKKRLSRCSIYLDASDDDHNVVEQLGLLTKGVFELEASGRKKESRERFYEIRPTAYLKLNSRLNPQNPVVFAEELGKTMCHRVGTKGKMKGWTFKSLPDAN